jgi:ribonucleoside-diphosphate reductase alpha chain
MSANLPGLNADAAVAVLAQASDQALCRDVLRDKYVQPQERDLHDVRRRLAAALAAGEAPGARARWQAAFQWALDNGFIPGGRIGATLGTGRSGTLLSCFVQPIGEPCREPGVATRVSVVAALREAARTLALGGGVGYDFSPLPPRGSRACGVSRPARGPLAWMRVFDARCEALARGGARRGAQMAVLRVDHPDIESFVDAKRREGLSSFNLAVAVSDAFMRAVEADDAFDLVHAARPVAALEARRNGVGRWVHRRVAARELWVRIARAAYDSAEPGLLFIDRINRDNNLSYCETIAATNPCGEQPLPPYGACDLGSLNLTAFVGLPFTAAAAFDWPRYRAVARLAVRALDNVLDLAAWPLPAQAREAMSKRRIGLGLTGLGDALMMLGLRYDHDEGRAMAARLARELRDAAARASVALARERGAFACFDAERYLEPPHAASRLPRDIREAIARHGIRNSHRTCIAPAGSISIAFAGNVSSGIEPVWGFACGRRRRMADGSVTEYAVEDFAWRLYRRLGGDPDVLPEAFLEARQIAAIDHLRMMAAVQPFIDAAISKTINLPAGFGWDDFRALHFDAWRAGLKGLTTWRPDAERGAVLVDAAQAGSRNCSPSISGCAR